MNVIVLGATKGMGRAVARQLAGEGARLVLMGRDVAELERSAADLEVRGTGGRPAVVRCDLEEPDGFEAALVEAWRQLGKVDAVVVTAGLFGTQDELEAHRETARRVMTVNYVHTVLFCEAARVCILAQGGGTLCVFSSVAGDRGRKPVGLYGSSKAGLSHYLESLDFRYHDKGLRVLVVKPGFVRTGMTAGLKPPPFAGEPEGVAKDVVSALRSGRSVLYTPWPWYWVMAIIRRLPRFVMRRVGF